MTSFTKSLIIIFIIFNIIKTEELDDKPFRRPEPVPYVDSQDSNGDTPLILAVKNGYVEVAEVLLQHGADPNIQNDLGNTALIIAAMKKDVNIILLLLKYDVDPDIANTNGDTAISILRNGNNE